MYIFVIILPMSDNELKKMVDQLAWQVELGADESTDNTPNDHFLGPKEGIKQRELGSNTPSRQITNIDLLNTNQHKINNGNQLESAKSIADSCKTPEELVKAIRLFEDCPLKKTATSTVIYDGSIDADIMIIGEAPGAEEDKKGLPFVGSAGKLLDKMLLSIKKDRTDCYITNIVNWRPPGNRTPTTEEIAICKPFVEKQIKLVSPKVIVLVGGVAAKTMLNKEEGITRIRGKWYSIVSPDTEDEIATIATFHPAYLLRQPSAKRKAWSDLLKVQEKLRNIS